MIIYDVNVTNDLDAAGPPPGVPFDEWWEDQRPSHVSEEEWRQQGVSARAILQTPEDQAARETTMFGEAPPPTKNRVAFSDPYGLNKAVSRGVAGPGVATEEDYQRFLKDVQEGITPAEGTEPFLGFGEMTDVVLRQDIVRRGREALPVGDTPDPGEPIQSIDTVFGRPLYRRNAQYAFGTRLSAEEVRSWQTFFGGLGFRTGWSGVWGVHEAEAMKSFMTAANNHPGGGMTVGKLKDLTMQQVRAGTFFFRGINEEGGDLLPLLLGADTSQIAPDLTGTGGGGAGGAEETGQPIQQTSIERRIERFSAAEGRMALKNLMAQSIGRAPSDDEVNQYVRGLNAAFAEDPHVVTSITNTDPITGEVVTETEIDESDVSAEGEAEEFAREGVPEDELREFQTGRYMDSLISAIGM